MTKTITTYYCDRCGKKMEESHVFWCETHPNTAIQILLGGEWNFADLCDNCKKSFKCWWEKSSASLSETESEDT